MASSLVVGALRVLLTANSAEFEAAMKSGGAAAKRLSKEFKDTGRQLSDVGSTLTKAITLPLVGIGAGAAKLAIDFESSFAEVRKTVDATAGEFDTMRTAIRNLSKEIPVNVNELNRLVGAAGALGIPKDRVVEFARVMAQLGVTTNVTSDQAAEAIAKIQNIFGRAGQDTERLGSTLVALGNKGASTESQILDMATRIAGAGSAIGITRDQVFGIASALSSVGLEAEAGGTAISRVFSNMASAVSRGGEDLNQFARVAGMSASDFAQKFKTDAAGAVLAFIEGLGRIKTSGGDLNGTLDEMGIKEVRLRDTLIRAAGAGDLLRNSLNTAKDAWQQNTALSDEATKRFQTFESQMTLLWNRVKDVGIELGTALMPAMRSALEAANALVPAISSLAQWFAGLPQPVQTLIIGLGAFAAAAGPVLFVLGQMATGVSTLITLFGTKGIALKALSTSYGALAPVLQGVVVALGGAAGVGIAGAALAAMYAMNELEKATHGAFQRAQEGKATWSDIPSLLGNAVSRGLNPFGAAWRDLQDFIAKAGEAWKGLSEWASTKFAPLIEASQGLLKSLGEAWAALKDLIVAVAGVIIAKVEELGAGIVSWLGEKLKPVFDFFDPALKAVSAAFSTAKESIVGFAQRTYEGVLDWLVTKMTGIVEAIKQRVDKVTGFFKTMYDKVVGNSYVPDMVSGIAQQFGMLQGGMVQPAQDATARVGEVFRGMRDSVASHLTSALTHASSWKDALLGILNDLRSRGIQIINDFINRGINALVSKFMGVPSGGMGGGGLGGGMLGFGNGQGSWWQRMLGIPGAAGAAAGIGVLGGGSMASSAGALGGTVGFFPVTTAAPGVGTGAAAGSSMLTSGLTGGLIGGGIGAGVGMYVGGRTGNMWGGIGSGAGSGAAAGAMFGGPIGAGIGAIIGGLGGWYAAKKANKKANDIRDRFFLQYGRSGTDAESGFGRVAARLTEAGAGAGGGQLFQNLIKANDPKELAAAIEAVKAKLAEYEAKTQAAKVAEEQQAAAIAQTKAELDAKTEAIHSQMQTLDDELKALNESEAPEEVMGTVEKRTRERIAKEKEALQAQLDAAQQAAAAAIEAINQAGTESVATLATQSADTTGTIIDQFVQFSDAADVQIERVRQALAQLGKTKINIPIGYTGGGVHGLPPEFTDGDPSNGEIYTATGSGIPGHAAGGVFSSPHLARIAEGGQSEIVGSVDFMSRALAGAMSRAGGASSMSTIIIEMDGRVLARGMVPHVPGEARRLGMRVRA